MRFSKATDFINEIPTKVEFNKEIDKWLSYLNYNLLFANKMKPLNWFHKKKLEREIRTYREQIEQFTELKKRLNKFEEVFND